MRAVVDGGRVFDSRLVQGLFWGTVFQNITGNFTLPDDPQVTYVFSATGAVTRNITLPRLIGNTGFGPSVGFVAANINQLNGLYVEILNASTVAANLLQAVSAAGDGGANIGGTIAIGAANVATMGQFQVINGAWFRIL